MSSLRRLTEAKVEFVLVGGMAAIAHGSASVTQDVDVCIRFDEQTLSKVLTALRGTNPRERMSAARPALSDLLGEVIAVGGLDALQRSAVTLGLGGFQCSVIGLRSLIDCKRALGRPKDLRVATELEAVLARVTAR